MEYTLSKHNEMLLYILAYLLYTFIIPTPLPTFFLSSPKGSPTEKQSGAFS